MKEHIKVSLFVTRFFTFMVMLLALNLTLYAETVQSKKRVSGRVTDTTGELLAGVTIMEKGTTNGTVSDLDGQYTLQVEDPHNAILLISYLGYKSQERKVGTATLIDFVMEEEVSDLNEVVVVAYGEQRKISVIGAQSTLKQRDLKQPVANLSSSLAGRVAGVVAVQRTGEPGKDNSDIWIRGLSTFAGQSSNPLILVDGVERAFNNIDPEDIESFTILKDASATAVYGVRGANGVIIIKTKPGKPGKPVFSVDYYESVTQLTKMPQLADGVTYMRAANEAERNSSSNPSLYIPKYSEEYIQNTIDQVDKYLYPDVDWFKEMYNDFGHNRRANVNVRGGSTDASYYASLSYFNERGLTKTDDLEGYNSDLTFTRYNFVTNVNVKATSKTWIDIGIQGYVSEGNYPAISTKDAFEQAMWMTPVAYPVLYPDRSVPGVNPFGDQRNPYADIAMRGYKNEYRNRFNSNVKVTQDLDFWTFLRGLRFSATLAFDTYNWHDMNRSKRPTTYYVDRNDPYVLDEEGNKVKDSNGEYVYNLNRTFEGNNTLGYSKTADGDRKMYLEALLNYGRTFGDHNVSALFMFNQSSKTVTTNANDFYAAAPYRDRGIAARLTYSFLDKYFAEFNIGYNGAENFAPENRYGTFPAIGVGWVVSNEKFWEPILPVVSFFKIRYTDGYVGSSSITGGRRFAYTDQMSTGSSVPGATYGKPREHLDGVTISQYAIPARWEKARKQDLGIDLKMFKDELSIGVDLYKEHRTDIFLQRQGVPLYVGLASMPQANLGIVDSEGLELTMEYNKPLTKDMFLTLRGNLTWAENEVIENDKPYPAYPWMEGKRGDNVLARYGYIADGLFESYDEIPQTQEEAGKNGKHAWQMPGLSPGDIKYRDLNGDGVIDDNDRCKIGEGDVPKIMYGFGFDFQWKNLSVGMLFMGIHGADRYLNGKCIQPFSGDGGVGNLYTNIEDRWTEDNPSQDVFYPRLAWGGGDQHNQNNFRQSTWWIKSVDFIRLKNCIVTYRFPKKWTNKVSLQGAEVYFMGSNLFTISDFKLWDPELNTDNGTLYPNVATYSLGLSFNF